MSVFRHLLPHEELQGVCRWDKERQFSVKRFFGEFFSSFAARVIQERGCFPLSKFVILGYINKIDFDLPYAQ